ncbi:XRE family transcriptional regulator [Marinicauda sp. Alg238-R41]|uniref:XRE family transcriptional regulator n=1 Tax=Marinicauda sp. Alg238-R41 TaxID=2993447 RepID=UPI0022E07873|nr:XRE family transcriptional regulator [Marinicauda sp. Alg238-R41]
MSFNDMSPIELGRRLRTARESAGLKQAEAAEAIEVARTTLVAIEKGERRIKIDELQKLAHRYGLSANRLLRREAVHVDLVPRFRRLSESSDPDVLEAAKLLNELVAAEVELEDLLGAGREYNYPPQKPLRSGNVITQAEEDAEALRNAFGLGAGAIPDIFSFIELTLGIRLYQRHLPSKISGLFTYDPSVGAAILLNASHPIERRRQSAAHEVGHFVATRDAPEVLDDDEPYTSREERYANAFGRALLTPRKAVEGKFRELTAGEDRLSRRIVILLADAFGISREAMVRRLEELGLVLSGTWDWFQSNGGFKLADVERVLGRKTLGVDQGKEEAAKPFSPKIGLMAYRVWKRELMTEGQLSDLLKVDRVTLREHLYELQDEESEADELPKLP